MRLSRDSARADAAVLPGWGNDRIHSPIPGMMVDDVDLTSISASQRA